MSRVTKQGKHLVVEVPDHVAKALDLSEGSECAWDLLNEKTATVALSENVSSVEVTVLKKLSSIKFAERTKENVAKVLKSDDEKKALGALMKKNAVSFYEEGKYKDRGVYSISRDYYGYASQKEEEKEKGKNIVEKVFGDKKFIVVSNKAQAHDMLSQLQDQPNVVSLKAFDGNYYITTNDVIEQYGSKVVAALEGQERKIEDLCEIVDAEAGLCKTVLEVLKESGDVIEKRRDLYALA